MTSQGFDGRIFLFQEEWETYLRRPPVRYIRRQTKNDGICHICGGSGDKKNPLQWAHRVPFMVGVKRFALTPDFLDSEENIVRAHRKTCNKKVEMDEREIECFLNDVIGVVIPEFLK